MKTVAFVCFVCGLVPSLRAQEPLPTASPTPPPGPLLERAPTFSQWTITNKIVTSDEGDKPPAAEITPGPAGSSASPSPSPSGRARRPGRQTKAEPIPATRLVPEMEQTTAVTKTVSIRYEHTTDKAGVNVERWCFPGIQITIQKGAPAVVSLPSSSGAFNYVDYSETDFDGFQWISEHNFKGIDMVGSQECYMFRDKVKGAHDPADVLSERVACINTATRLPVTLQVDDELYTYQFELAPTAMLKPPTEVVSQVEQWRKSVQQSSLMPAKP